MRRPSMAVAAAGALAAIGALPALFAGPVDGPACALPAANCQAYSGAGGYDSSGGELFVTADDFTPGSSGSVTEVCFWGVYVPDPGTPPVDDFTITYYQDDGAGYPGTVLARFSGADLTITGPAPTGDTTGGGFAIFEFTASHAAVAVSAGTCYWIEIVNPNDGSFQWFWLWNDGTSGNGWSFQDGSPPDGYDAGDNRDTDLAFCAGVALGDASGLCGPPAECGPGAGPCDVPNDSPGCEDPACCALVCSQVPVCCLVPWSESCVEVAAGEGCLVLEPEPCQPEANCQVTDLLGHGGWDDTLAAGATSDASFPTSVAENFTPAVSGTLNELCWWGFYFDFDAFADCSQGAADQFTVTYYADDGGLPGAQLARHAVSTTREPDGRFFTGGVEVTAFRYDATHPDVTVDAGACYWIEITNDLDGACLWLWQTSPPGDAYSLQDFDGDGYEVADGENFDLSWCAALELADPAACGYRAPAQACSAGDVELTRSVDPDTILAGNAVACMAPPRGPPFWFNLETAYARLYDLAAIPETAGQPVSVRCVQFGIEENRGGAVAATVNLYQDADGAPPVHPDIDLALLGSVEVVVPASVEGALLAATFDPPVEFPADSSLVVEVIHPDRNPVNGADRGGMLAGSNDLGQTGPSYIRAADCQLEDFVDLADVGFPDLHLVQRVTVDTAGDPCPWDCDEPTDGAVGIQDFLTLLVNWEQVGVPCDLGLGEPGVGIEEFLDLLVHWGPCP